MQEHQHSHDFTRINRKGERRTLWVLLLTFATMVLEIGAGVRFHSMALLADGWHMATHVLAFLIAIFAYRYSRIHEKDKTFAFSPAKVGVLGGFASSIALAMVAVLMMIEAGERLIVPHSIHFDEAIWIAVFGLLVNLLCALLLRDHDHHNHNHNDHHAHHHADHGHHHHDHNLHAAYLHVLADALTSVLAIVALLAGKYYGWVWLDALMGLVGAWVILGWAFGLIRKACPVLLDQGVDEHYLQAIQYTLEDEGDCQVTDLHIWRISPSHHAAIIGLVTPSPKSPGHYKRLLSDFVHLDHITVEVNRCPDDHSQSAP
ncbi:MAG: CDF family Co(II)/Ni(II) efflux transporter DmeF [Methylomonas sp.]|nr:CDF family Co(II)/Ni(II) efflux transporter DmeF [Methylomonas sp.]PPD21342.1 MAG: cation transporter [Methylomonas sp.]PPD26917.1 MAG: cation transporter [Methylomonas sp.]PPD38847.1 MAG: cation transporter [Methylomonas sp.]PPD41719.1 MAG: cation transporter [Methylomonas sp.]